MSKKNRSMDHDGNINSGNKIINLAKSRGADIQPNAHGRFTSVETTKGKMFILPGDSKLDPKTISTAKKWLRLLGLLCILVALYLIDHFLYIAGVRILI